MRKARLWMIGVGATSLVACAPVCYPYIYISLEQIPGIRVDRVGRVEHENLWGSSAMPVEYRLVRKRYTLYFSVLQRSIYPSLKVSIDSEGYSIQFHRDMNVRAPNGTICASFYSATTNSFDFGWISECVDPKLPKRIDFDVRNSSGETVARESITFRLKENGFYTVMDAI